MTYARHIKSLFALLVASCMSTSCGLFDSGIVWRHGPYGLLWIDLTEDVRLSYDMGNGSWLGKVEPRVFAVGANSRHIVAKQHPGGAKNVTNYFIIDLRVDSPMNTGVIGPLTAEAFSEKSRDLALPEFTKILTSLQ